MQKFAQKWSINGKECARKVHTKKGNEVFNNITEKKNPENQNEIHNLCREKRDQIQKGE